LLSVLPSHRLRKLGQYLPQSLEDALLFNAAFVEPDIVTNLLAAKCADRFQYRRELIGKIADSSDDPLGCMLRLDLKTYLVAILGRMDKMTMAASIEGRVPFLDHRLVEWATRLSSGLKLPGLQTKPTVKRLAVRYLPHEVVHRKKSGFWRADCRLAA